MKNLIYRKRVKIPGTNGHMNISKSGIGTSMPIGNNMRLTHRVNGKKEVHVNLGNGLRFRMPLN